MSADMTRESDLVTLSCDLASPLRLGLTTNFGGDKRPTVLYSVSVRLGYNNDDGEPVVFAVANVDDYFCTVECLDWEAEFPDHLAAEVRDLIDCLGDIADTLSRYGVWVAGDAS